MVAACHLSPEHAKGLPQLASADRQPAVSCWHARATCRLTRVHTGGLLLAPARGVRWRPAATPWHGPPSSLLSTCAGGLPPVASARQQPVAHKNRHLLPVTGMPGWTAACLKHVQASCRLSPASASVLAPSPEGAFGMLPVAGAHRLSAPSNRCGPVACSLSLVHAGGLL